MTDKPVIFLPGDPDAETGVPPIVMLANGPALRCSEMRLTVGVRKQGAGEDLLLSMASTGGATLFSAFTPTTARVLGQSLIDWAGAQETKATRVATDALARAGGRER